MRTEENIINVIFDAGRGSVSVASREAAVGESFGKLPQPTRTGYRFDGWYLGENLITEHTAVESDEDIRLVAHWSKMRDKKKTFSMLKKQRIAAVVLSVLCVVMILTLLVTNHVVSIYKLEDVYYSDDGTKYTERYYIKKKSGQYGLYDQSGTLMEYNAERGYFTAHSGNQYTVDLETGEYSLYAVVDFDAEAGELLSTGNRLMIFPEITGEDIYSIDVKNQTGSYRLYRDENGNVKIAGGEDVSATYDAYMFAYLSVSCGYTSTTMKLDFWSENSTAPRLADGTIDYSAYGLADLYDGEGNLIYTPSVYTITKAAYDKSTGLCAPATEMIDADGDGIAETERVIQYTVKIGDPILSDSGYYVQLVGRDAVYIVDSGLGATALQPIEALITPQINYPMSAIGHVMVQNFLLGKVDLKGDIGTLENIVIDPIVEFSYQDSASRSNTIYSATPYVTPMDFMLGYDINDDNVQEVLGSFYGTEFVACKKFGITEEALREYKLDGEVHYLTFESPVMDDNNSITGYITNTMIISDKTENGTYYVASFEYGMIVEVDEYYFSFLEWEQNQWYAPRFFRTNISYVTQLHIQIGEEVYNFRLDNSETTQEDVVNSANLKVFCDRYLNGKTNPNRLDYKAYYTYVNDKGEEKTASVDGVSNFRKLYITLLEYSIMGDFDEDEFKQNMGMSFQEYLADENTVCDAEISFHAKDYASTMNNYYYKDENGNQVKLYPEDNVQDVVYRFYRYTGGKALLTVEVLKDTDGDGVLDSDPKNGQYAFYVKASYLNDILSDINKLLSEQPIEPET